MEGDQKKRGSMIVRELQTGLPSSVPDCFGNATPTDCDVIRGECWDAGDEVGDLGRNGKQHRFSVRFGKAASNKTI